MDKLDAAEQTVAHPLEPVTDRNEGLHTAIAGVEQEVAQLKDLFVRRLLEDRQKGQLIESLNQQLKVANDLVEQRVVEPIIQEMLVAVDRLTSVEDESGHHQSVAAEILEVFYRRGLEHVDTTGDFNPQFHHAVAQISADKAESQVGRLTELRSGYLLNGRVIRPALVQITV
ncbi:molecular chaperone GrpE [Micrococcales bacterium KH10]|nr:molecular chaperone GrpE [Micrococcales bacterium KH10]